DPRSTRVVHSSRGRGFPLSPFVGTHSGLRRPEERLGQERSCPAARPVLGFLRGFGHPLCARPLLPISSRRQSMKRFICTLALALCMAVPAFAADAKSATPAAATPEWAMNATIIEACSCPMFCQCYFSTKPAAHAMAHEGHEGMAEHYCRANNVFQVNKGYYGKTKLDGAKFWAAMDLGDDFSDGTMKWVVVTFDPSVSKEQREGIAAVLGHLYPVKWEQP